MGTDRRDFLKKALYGLLALFGLGFLVPAARLLSPSGGGDRTVRYVPLVPEEDVPRAGVRKAELVFEAGGRERKSRVFIVAGPAGLKVFSAVCSHLGCLVNYRKEKKEFLCPCHGGRYDITGTNIAGPPPAPLTPLPVRIEQGMVLVGVKV